MNMKKNKKSFSAQDEYFRISLEELKGSTDKENFQEDKTLFLKTLSENGKSALDLEIHMEDLDFKIKDDEY